MSDFVSAGWGIYVAVATLASVLGCGVLLYLMGRMRVAKSPSADTGPQTTGHVWDEDLAEYNNPLPRWWMWLFYITIVFSLVYLVLYPGLGPAEAQAALERLREAVAARLAAGAWRVTASVGGVSCAHAPADAATLIEAADARMYAAKSAGRDQVVLALLDEPPVRAPFPRQPGGRVRP